MPCADLLSWWSLRCGVWLVFLLALLGNGAVLLVSALSPASKVDVPRSVVTLVSKVNVPRSVSVVSISGQPGQ